jgi:hypothetical protein
MGAMGAIGAIGATGCEEPRRRPWEIDADGGPPPVFTPSPSSLPLHLPPAGSGDTKGDAAVPADLIPVSPVRVGGPWVRCYGNFRISGDPVKDVTRLALLCGPENGMKRLSPQTIVGSVIEGQPGVSETFQARRGECYRVFAAAERTVSDLDITVRSSRDMAIAADHGEDGWPIAQPDRPFCVLEDDALRVEISARRGQGRFAAEIWVLSPPPRPD